ncbi:MAG: hypothetical protein K0S41_1461 [Anaerocolumna sp.]|nr:hypothetical protein [Anaerocolumna sp.]
MQVIYYREKNMIYFETKRLVFRDWDIKDLNEFRKMNKDTKVMEYFTKTLTDLETDRFYNIIQDEFKNYGYGLYAVETKHNNDFIGFIGFHWANFKSQFTPCIEIGWRLKQEAWGYGYATEGAKACLNYGFDTLGFNKVYSFTSKINIPSENVMKKVGMVKVLEFEHPNIIENDPLRKHILYTIDSINAM